MSDDSIENGITRSLLLSAVKQNAWNRVPMGKKTGIRGTSMLLQLKLLPEVLRAVHDFSTHFEAAEKLCGSLIGTKSSPSHYLSLKVEDCRWHGRTTRRTAGEFPIALCPFGGRSVQDLESSLSSIIQELSSHSDDQPLEPLQVFRCQCQFQNLPNSRELRMRFVLLYPKASLLFTPVNSLKIVSTHLSVLLVRETKKPQKFQTGFLTLDQNRRVVVLQPSDPIAARFPLIGIWTAGVPTPNSPGQEKLKQHPYLHPLVWVAAIRYLQTTSVSARVSPSPESHTFLLLHFDPQPHFYEVSSSVCLTQPSEALVWTTECVEQTVSLDHETIISFAQPGTARQRREPDIVRSWVSQSQAVSPIGSPKAAMTSRTERHSEECREDRKSKTLTKAFLFSEEPNNLRYSVENSLLSRLRLTSFPPEEAEIPKIHYEPSEGSSEDEAR